MVGKGYYEDTPYLFTEENIVRYVELLKGYVDDRGWLDEHLLLLRQLFFAHEHWGAFSSQVESVPTSFKEEGYTLSDKEERAFTAFIDSIQEKGLESEVRAAMEEAFGIDLLANLQEGIKKGYIKVSPDLATILALNDALSSDADKTGKEMLKGEDSSNETTSEEEQNDKPHVTISDAVEVNSKEKVVVENGGEISADNTITEDVVKEHVEELKGAEENREDEVAAKEALREATVEDVNEADDYSDIIHDVDDDTPPFTREDFDKYKIEEPDVNEADDSTDTAPSNNDTTLSQPQSDEQSNGGNVESDLKEFGEKLGQIFVAKYIFGKGGYKQFIEDIDEKKEELLSLAESLIERGKTVEDLAKATRLGIEKSKMAVMQEFSPRLNNPIIKAGRWITNSTFRRLTTAVIATLGTITGFAIMPISPAVGATTLALSYFVRGTLASVAYNTGILANIHKMLDFRSHLDAGRRLAASIIWGDEHHFNSALSTLRSSVNAVPSSRRITDFDEEIARKTIEEGGVYPKIATIHGTKVSEEKKPEVGLAFHFIDESIDFAKKFGIWRKGRILLSTLLGFGSLSVVYWDAAKEVFNIIGSGISNTWHGLWNWISGVGETKVITGAAATHAAHSAANAVSHAATAAHATANAAEHGSWLSHAWQSIKHFFGIGSSSEVAQHAVNGSTVIHEGASAAATHTNIIPPDAYTIHKGEGLWHAIKHSLKAAYGEKFTSLSQHQQNVLIDAIKDKLVNVPMDTPEHFYGALAKYGISKKEITLLPDVIEKLHIANPTAFYNKIGAHYLMLPGAKVEGLSTVEKLRSLLGSYGSILDQNKVAHTARHAANGVKHLAMAAMPSHQATMPLSYGNGIMASTFKPPREILGSHGAGKIIGSGKVSGAAAKKATQAIFNGPISYPASVSEA